MYEYFSNTWDIYRQEFLSHKKWLLNPDNAEIFKFNQAKSHSNMTVMDKQATVKTEEKSQI